MVPTQTIDYPCPTCTSPMGLGRVSPLDRQYDLRFFKCEVCKCEVCSHMYTGKNQGEAVKNLTAAIKRPRPDEAAERIYSWVRATPIPAPP
jgi:hypothetical protein